MIRLVIGFFMLLGSTGFIEKHGDLWFGIVWSLIGLGLVVWPVLTGYFEVSPEKYYIDHQ